MTVLSPDTKTPSSSKGQSKKLLWKGHGQWTNKNLQGSNRKTETPSGKSKGTWCRVHLKSLCMQSCKAMWPMDEKQLINYCFFGGFFVFKYVCTHLFLYLYLSERDFNTTMQIDPPVCRLGGCLKPDAAVFSAVLRKSLWVRRGEDVTDDISGTCKWKQQRCWMIRDAVKSRWTRHWGDLRPLWVRPRCLSRKQWRAWWVRRNLFE